MNKLSYSSLSLQSDNTKSFKACLFASSAAVALVLSLGALQPAQADEAVGQMIDDSGLVICSYADGSIKEFKSSRSELRKLELNSLDNVHQGTVLSSALLGGSGPAIVVSK